MKYINDIETFNTKIKRIEKLLFLSKFFKNKKLFLTSLEEQNHAGKILLTSILKYHHAKGLITISKIPEENLKNLKDIIAKEWGIQKEIENILKLFELHKKHKESPIEFMKKGKIIILDKHQNIEKISIHELTLFTTSIKIIKNSFQSNFQQTSKT